MRRFPKSHFEPTVSVRSVWISNSAGCMLREIAEERPKDKPEPFGWLLYYPRRMRSSLSDLEIRRALGGLPGWTRKGEVVSKTYTFARFADGIQFVAKVAELADEMDHHPDIDIRYTNVTFSLSTHSAGGITQLDLDLAKKIESAAGF